MQNHHSKPKHLRHGALAPSGEADNDAIHMNRTLSDWTTTQTASQQTTILSQHAGGDLYVTLSAPITASCFCVGWRHLISCINCAIILRFSNDDLWFCKEAFYFWTQVKTWERGIFISSPVWFQSRDL